ncbi:MAG: cation transporter [Clostridia bacterium]|nr:cation transporter [Clostridia bacterium]
MKNHPSRYGPGIKAGAVGIAVNLILSVGKIAVGALFGSMSVTADGFNNLSDAAASLITWIGFRFSEKPADREHPYGHARFEYLAALTVSVFILVIGFELLRSAVDKIFHPAPVSASPLLTAVLLLSVAAKLFLTFFFRSVGNQIHSKALLASSLDSRNDVIVTSGVLLTVFLDGITSVNVDGIGSLLIALFVLYSGITLAKETLSPLLGEGGDPELRESITAHVKACPNVIGCHDLMIHDYGPERCYATLHVEMDKNMDSMECHRLLDGLERECLEKFRTHLVIHLDPVLMDDPETERLKRVMEALLKCKNASFEMHDFRLYPHKDFTEISFDLRVPEGMLGDENAIRHDLENTLRALEEKDYRLKITLEL